ncbi:MAG TPA: oligosaccharide flippase family protein [Fulvivirga sp.]|nr:oligosaccharide flippase family protein [Fulvivirga sp.]
MGIVSRTSIKFSIILYIGIVLGYVNMILIFPNVLGDELFGLTRILFTAAALIAQIAQLGTSNILVRFHPFLKEDKKNSTLSLGLILSFIGVLLSSSFLFIFKNWIIEVYSEKAGLFTEYYYLLLPAVVSLIFFNLFEAYLRVLLKNSVSAFLNSVLLRLVWLALVILYSFQYFDTSTFINLYVGGQVIMTVLAFIYTVTVAKLNLGFDLSSEKIKILKTMSQYGIVTILSGLSLLLINRIDVVMIGSYLGLEEVAIYSIAFYMSMVIIVPAQSISRASAVLVADAFKKNDLVTIKSLYEKTALNQMLFGSIVFIAIIINYKSLMSFLPPNYADSFFVFLFLGLGKIIDTGFGMNGFVILTSKYFKVDTIMSVGLLILSIIIKVFFIPHYGITGAALSTAIALLLFNFSKFLFLKWKMDLTPFTKDYMKLVLLLIGSCFVTMVIPFLFNIWVDMILRSALFLLLVIPATFYLNISPEFNEIIKKGWAMVRKK